MGDHRLGSVIDSAFDDLYSRLFAGAKTPPPTFLMPAATSISQPRVAPERPEPSKAAPPPAPVRKVAAPLDPALLRTRVTKLLQLSEVCLFPLTLTNVSQQGSNATLRALRAELEGEFAYDFSDSIADALLIKTFTAAITELKGEVESARVISRSENPAARPLRKQDRLTQSPKASSSMRSEAKPAPEPALALAPAPASAATQQKRKTPREPSSTVLASSPKHAQNVEWTRELDLAFSELLWKQWGSDVWQSNLLRKLSFLDIFAGHEWPACWNANTLGDRWENYRKWVPRSEPKDCADVVKFKELFAIIKARPTSAYHNPAKTHVAVPIGVKGSDSDDFQKTPEPKKKIDLVATKKVKLGKEEKKKKQEKKEKKEKKEGDVAKHEDKNDGAEPNDERKHSCPKRVETLALSTRCGTCIIRHRACNMQRPCGACIERDIADECLDPLSKQSLRSPRAKRDKKQQRKKDSMQERPIDVEVDAEVLAEQVVVAAATTLPKKKQNQKLGTPGDLVIQASEHKKETKEERSGRMDNCADAEMHEAGDEYIKEGDKGEIRKVSPVRDGASRRACHECGTQDSKQWRSGAAGPKTLCLSCGLRYTKNKRKHTKVEGSTSPAPRVANGAPRLVSVKPDTDECTQLLVWRPNPQRPTPPVAFTFRGSLYTPESLPALQAAKLDLPALWRLHSLFKHRDSQPSAPKSVIFLRRNTRSLHNPRPAYLDPDTDFCSSPSRVNKLTQARKRKKHS